METLAAHEPVATGLPADVESALALLSPRQQACVVLRYLEDLPVRETARLLGVSEGAVKRYASEGVTMLTRVLGVVAPTESAPVTPVSKEGRHDA